MVSGGERGWYTYLVYTIFVIGAGLLVAMAFLILTAPRLFDLDVGGGLLGVAAMISGLGALDRIPRRVTLGSDSLEIRYPLSRIRLRWEELDSPVPSTRGFLDFRVIAGTRGVVGGLTVTTEQARAILRHPACPHFDLSLDVVDELKRLT